MTARRFPPPWTVEETQPCFIVRDATGALAFVYSEDGPGLVAGWWQKKKPWDFFVPGLGSSAPQIGQRPNQLKR
jgi:hypothetical protein